MKKEISISALKDIIKSDAVFETEVGYIANLFGKYKPNVTFVLGREVQLDGAGKPINPIEFISLPVVKEGTNMDFDGDVEVIFGNFWRSKKGGACFRPEAPEKAKHMLMKIIWGGPFNRTRGLREAPVGALYYHRASSNGGGAGDDYVVLPVGYSRRLDAEGNELFPSVNKNAAYVAAAAQQLKEAADKADAALRAKLAAEKESAESREKYLPRLLEIQAELAELAEPKEFGNYGIPELKLEESGFKLGYSKRLFNDADMAFVEKELARLREWVTRTEDEKRAKAEAEATFKPQYEKLANRCKAVGWTLDFNDTCYVLKPEEINPRRSNGVSTYAYEEKELDKLIAELEAAEASRV